MTVEKEIKDLGAARIPIKWFFALCGALLGSAAAVIASTFFLGSWTSAQVEARMQTDRNVQALSDKIKEIEVDRSDRIKISETWKRETVTAITEVKGEVKRVDEKVDILLRRTK